MSSHPTRRTHISFGPEPDDTDFIYRRKSPLQHAAACQQFECDWPLEVLTTKLKAIDSHIFFASGGWERGAGFDSSRHQSFRAPAGALCLATYNGPFGGATAWLLSEDGQELVVLAEDNYTGCSTRTITLSTEQTADLLMTLVDACRQDYESKCKQQAFAGSLGLGGPLVFARQYRIDPEAVQATARNLGVRLAPDTPLDNGWAKIERGVAGDVHGTSPNSLYLCVKCSFDEDVRQSQKYAISEGLIVVDTRHISRKLIRRLVGKNEAEAFLCRFRRVDGGVQAITAERNEHNSWHATLYSEVLDTLLVRSATSLDKDAVIYRLQLEANKLLSLEKQSKKGNEKNS